jgi:hypothetical protein
VRGKTENLPEKNRKRGRVSGRSSEEAAMKMTPMLRTSFFAILAFTVGLIAPAPAKDSPTPAKTSPAAAKDVPPICNRKIKVQVIALDQPWMWNRLGAAQPGGMIYALARDVVSNVKVGVVNKDGPLPEDLSSLKAADLMLLCGNVRLRDDKRARPLVLRANKGDCLEITFANLLSPQPPAAQKPKIGSEPTRWAGLNSTGVELVKADTNAAGIDSDASWVGTNANSLAKNGEIKTYKWYATEEGTFLLYSGADNESGYQANQGLFGAINVEPEDAEWYRSQVTHEDLVQATLRTTDLSLSQRIDAVAAPDPVQKTLAPEPVQKTQEQLGLSPDFKPGVMENRIPDKISRLPVFVNEKKDDQRILSASGHPLINYYAVYRDLKTGKELERFGHPVPILQMLQVKTGKLRYDKPLKKDNPGAYFEDVKALESGIIPADLRKIFKDLTPSVDLSARARVVDQNRNSWLITDQGQAFYVQATETPGGAKSATAGVLKIFEAQLELIYSDLTAVITGPNAARFALSNTSPSFRNIPASPDRRQPYREYTIIYHQAFFAAQAFAAFSNANLVNVIQSGADNFAINYGSAAIAPEVVANRLGIGPMGNPDAVDLKFEEFFLSAWSVGDPAMVVDHPANATNAIVGSPDEHRQLRTELPPKAPARELGDPKRSNPPASDDFAPLPTPPVKATKAFFPDDPSNVYHSYMSDHVKFRILHAGAGPSHVHHLHAHQWLRSPDSDSSQYLDSQLIVPGTAFTLEITYNGSGNRNKTVGDSIFHCHFYPHFAQGMWALWRVHDVFEEGTILESDGKPKTGINRALPDGEIIVGTPIPAVVPLPTLAMAPVPAKVKLTDLSPWKPGQGQGRRVEVIPEGKGPDGKNIYKNPGYPFFVPGVSGHRPPHPPLDFAWLEDPATRLPVLDGDKKIYLDGGLPRHMILDGTVVKEFHTRWDFSKDTWGRDKQGNIVGSLTAMQVPEEGTPVELAAMKEHSIRTRPTAQPNGEPGNFILNGLPPTNGAPFADPAVNDFGDANIHRRRYQAAVFQVDTILNKKGWHYPQQRMISLWQDVAPTVDKTRPPEPFFFRTNTADTIQFWHTNLVPGYYELDDFQVRTPTDIVGQHIHLVKFDVTASDGAGNGFNYEDGTFAADEVRERIDSINAAGGLFAFDDTTNFVGPPPAKQNKLTVRNVGDYYPPPGSTFVKLDNGVPQWTKPPGMPGSVFAPLGHEEEWDGAQTTIQLWEVDALLNNEGVDRTLRTVFSHDHFGPSTHQQAGLYAGMVVEPENSEWYKPDGERMNTRSDGGPTSWNGYIVTEKPEDSYREFMMEFQDLQLAYGKGSPTTPSATLFDPDKPKPSAAFALGQEHSAKQLSQANSLNQIFQTYADALDKSTLPGPFNFASVPLPGFTGVFPQFGIPLSDKAKVTVDRPGNQWTITEAPNQINAGTRYVVRASRGGQPPDAIQQMVVFTPDIVPGWAASNFVLNGRNPDIDKPVDDPDNARYGPPFAQIVSQNQFGTYSLNYRNEPVPYRVGIPGASPTPSSTQADLALAYSSIPRSDPDLNIQPGKAQGYPSTPLVPNAKGTDPYTPLLEAYVNDRVQIRTLVGAHTQAHAFQVHGVKWLFEADNTNSGWRNAQLMGLSEHFEMLFELPGTAAPHTDPLLKDMPPFADYFYSPSSDIVGLNNGLWGIMRAYGAEVDGVKPLPNNDKLPGAGGIDFAAQYQKAKSAGRPTREFDVTAVTASALKDGKLVYNARRPDVSTDLAVLYVQKDDLGKLKQDVPVEPLILRAAAGTWIKVTLHNGFDPKDAAFKTFQRLPYGTPFGAFSLPAAQMFTSQMVGLHPQLVAYDPVEANGLLVGFNPNHLVPPAGTSQVAVPPAEFYWYAGELKRDADGTVHEKPIEFGGTNLTSADPLLQAQFGMVGALIIEPEGSTWVEDANSRASADVKAPGGNDFREFVVIDQNMVANSHAKTSPTPNPLIGIGAINYRSEAFALRGPKPSTSPSPGVPPALPQPAPEGYSQAYSNTINKPASDPLTPIFTAAAGTPVRFRLLIPSTVTSNVFNNVPPPVFMVHGHPWQEEPYTDDSTKIGFNRLSQTQGAQQGGVGQKFDLLFPSAGGPNRIAGDYLYTTYQTANGTGTWGLFRVTDAKVAIEKAALENGFAQASGVVKPATDGAQLPKQLRACLTTDAGARMDLGTTSVAADGRWTLKVASDLSAPARIQVTAIGEDGQAGAIATMTITGPPSAEKLVMQSDQSASSLYP